MDNTTNSNIVMIEISEGAVTQIIANAATEVIVVNRDLNEVYNGQIQEKDAFTQIFVAEVTRDVVQGIYEDAVRNIVNSNTQETDDN